MKYLFLLLILYAPAFGQESVNPVRVSLTTAEGDKLAARLVKEIHARLPKYVAITTRRPDWRLTLAVVEDKCGFIGALVVTDPRGASQLSIHTSPDIESMGKMLAAKLNVEYFGKTK